jgi:hypothetical protein
MTRAGGLRPHIDMDCFYAAIEERDCPELRGNQSSTMTRIPTLWTFCHAG